MKIKIPSILSLVACSATLTFVACNDTEQKTDSKSKNFKYLDLANMDTTIKPGDDFFMYVNGSWIKNKPLPSDKARYGSFDEVNDRTVEDVNELILNAKTDSKDPNEVNIAKFFKAGMDSLKINELGIKPLQTFLDDIQSISSVEQLLKVTTKHYSKGVGYFIGTYVSPDEKDVNKIAVYLYQTGLGLPNKDFYTNTDSASKAIKLPIKLISQISLKKVA